MAYHFDPPETPAALPKADSKAMQDIVAWLQEAKPSERKSFFHPFDNVRHLEKWNERRDAFVKKFLLWSRYYFTPTLIYERAPFHTVYLGWLYEVFVERKPKQKIVYTCLTAREHLKTLDFFHYVMYAGAYGLRHYLWYMTGSEKKAADEFKSVRMKCSEPAFMRDYGNILEKSTVKVLHFKRGFKVDAMTHETIRRGLTHDGMKPETLVTDDIETAKTLDSTTDTIKIYDKYKSDFSSSAQQKSVRVYHNGNYLSDVGTARKLLDEADEKMIIGLYRDAEKEEGINWSGKYVRNDDDLYSKENQHKISIESLKASAKKQEFGMETFNAEMLCHPTSSELLYFDVNKIIEFGDQAEPKKIINDGGLSYVVYKLPNRESLHKKYAFACDLSEGAGLDSTVGLLAEFDKRRAEIIAVVVNNKIPQTHFAASNMRFFEHLKIRPYVGYEMPFGLAYGETVAENYPKQYMYKQRDERGGFTDKTGVRVTGANKSLLLGELKSAIEERDLIIPDNGCIKEIREFKKSDILDAKRRKDSTSSLYGITAHFDRISALAVLWQTIIQASEVSKSMHRQFMHQTNVNRTPFDEELLRRSV